MAQYQRQTGKKKKKKMCLVYKFIKSLRYF